MTPIADHPRRFALSNELHARPFPSLTAPATATFLAIKRPDDAAARDRGEDFLHLTKLLDHFGAPHPEPGATHYQGALGRNQLKWEQHTEFVTYTIFSNKLSDRAFDPVEFEAFPDDWLAQAPGVRFTSALVRIVPRPSRDETVALLKDWFVPESLAVSTVLDDSAIIAGDFRIDPAGHLRFAVFPSEGTGRQRIGRVVQRLCEIETYKSMSMLGFTRSQEMAAEMARIEPRLTSLIGEISDVEAEDALNELLGISAQLEGLSAKASFRFGATKAYKAIVDQRIDVLREERCESRQTFAEFMMRRYEPAMRTVGSTDARLQSLADRAMRAGELLRTKVDVARSAQNQKLLESMDRRSDMALRLQETVEGLSVVAISYYAVSLAGYLFYPLTETVGISKGMLLAMLTLPVVGAVWYMVRKIRARMH
ncbi:DUF3422 family protein [Cognatishimia activa]|uniref:Membrane-anchored protein n=1 Tax=Cognatishimia activa TaxID=1715691 RepID=A0A0P1IVS3_9RHOB|nr:DUF3422 domain-containing protein [Cognatishimia activa]CUJ21027.1 hypothetical protein TA5113_02655 [Cognatishimia activa]CUK25478.1 hypothetical protein TA5114_01277 [Cognatishimia activa]